MASALTKRRLRLFGFFHKRRGASRLCARGVTTCFHDSMTGLCCERGDKWFSPKRTAYQFILVNEVRELQSTQSGVFPRQLGQTGKHERSHLAGCQSPLSLRSATKETPQRPNHTEEKEQLWHKLESRWHSDSAALCRPNSGFSLRSVTAFYVI